MYVSSLTGASNARIDGMSVISVTYSTCLACNVSHLGTSDFSYSKAIAHCRSAISDQVEFSFLQSLELLQGLML